MARITDEAVEARTGKNWSAWFKILDDAGAREMTHKEIVAYLREHFDVGSWWRQMLTVQYEQERGLRAKHEMQGGFQIGASKTMAVPADAAYDAWADDEKRRAWLPEDQLSISTKNPEKSVRGAWGGGPSRLDVYFYPKGDDRTQVTVQHSKLDDAQIADEMKAFWRKALGSLEAFLTMKRT